MVVLMLAGLLGGCSPQEQAVLDPFPTALAAYDAGRAALERGDAGLAVEALTRAVQADARSAELWLWLGSAQAAAGDTQAAVASASQSLALRPGWAVALYDRACWQVRAGALEGAVVDLEAALATGEIGTLQAAADPDFDPLRAHPTLRARVPARGLPVLAEGAPESVFQGSDWTLTLHARHPLDAALVVGWQGPGPPGLSLRRVVEDASIEGGEHRRSVAWTWRVGGPFEGSVGPLTASSGGLDGQTGAVEVRFLAPAGAAAATGGVPSLPVSSAVFADHAEGVPTRTADRVEVRVAAGDRVSWQPRPSELVRHELRLAGQADWIGWEAVVTPETVLRIERGRRVLFEGPIP